MKKHCRSPVQNIARLFDRSQSRGGLTQTRWERWNRSLQRSTIPQVRPTSPRGRAAASDGQPSRRLRVRPQSCCTAEIWQRVDPVCPASPSPSCHLCPEEVASRCSSRKPFAVLTASPNSACDRFPVGSPSQCTAWELFRVRPASQCTACDVFPVRPASQCTACDLFPDRPPSNNPVRSPFTGVPAIRISKSEPEP